MAISRTQAVSATANNVAIASTQAGDIIVVWSYFAGTATIPTLAGGFTNIASQAGTAQACRLAYKVSPGGETTSGTWTNATQVVCHVYRGAARFGTTPTIAAGSSTALAYSAVTRLRTDGTSWILGFGGAASATAGMNGTPTGTAPNFVNATSQVKANGLDTNAVASANLTTQTLNVTTTGRWQTVTIELIAPFTQSFTPTLSPTAGLTRKFLDAGFTATLSQAAALTKQIRDAGFTAGLSFVGSFTKAAVHIFLKNFSATLFSPGLNDGDTVDIFPDKTGNGHYGIRVGNPIFKKNIVNGNPVVRFTTASGDGFNLASIISGVQPYTVFVVAKPAALGSRLNTLVGNDSLDGIRPFPFVFVGGTLYTENRDVYVGIAEPTPSAFRVLTTIHNQPSTTKIFIDGVDNSGPSTAFPTIGDFVSIGYGIGAPTPSYSDGDIAAILFCTGVLSATDHQNAEKTFSVKYGTATPPAGSVIDLATLPGLTAWWEADSILSIGGAATLTISTRKILTASLSWIGNLVTNWIHTGGTLFTKAFTATLFPQLKDGDTLNIWPDKVSGNNGISPVGTVQFQTNQINGLPAISFSSGGMSLTTLIPASASGASWTQIVLMKCPFGQLFGLASNASNGDAFRELPAAGRIQVQGASKGFISSPSLGGDGLFHIYSVTLDFGTATARAWVDGTERTDLAYAFGEPPGDFASIGADFVAAQVGFGWIPVLLYFNTVLSDTDRANAEKTVANKYALSVASGTPIDLSSISSLAGWWEADATNPKSVTFNRRTGKALSATKSFVGSLTITTAFKRAFTATLSFVGNLSVSKAFLKAFTATLSFSGNLSRIVAHFFLKAFTATLAFTGTLSFTHRFARALAATLSFTGAISRRTGKALGASLSFSGTIGKGIRKVFNPILSFATFFFRGAFKLFRAGQITGSSLQIHVTGSTITVQQAESQLTVERTE